MSGTKGMKSDRPIKVNACYSPDFLKEMDGRVSMVKALKYRYNMLKADLGNDLSYQQNALVKRVIHIESILETTEQQLMDGKQIDMNKYLNAINTLTGLLKNLGLYRKSKTIPSLQEYIKAQDAKQ